GPARAKADLYRRPQPLRRGVAGGGSRAGGGRPDRRPPRPGLRRGADGPGGALVARGALSGSGSTGPCRGGVGWTGRDRGGLGRRRLRVRRRLVLVAVGVRAPRRGRGDRGGAHPPVLPGGPAAGVVAVLAKVHVTVPGGWAHRRGAGHGRSPFARLRAVA